MKQTFGDAVEIGFHGHHNLAMGVANSVAAIEAGATRISPPASRVALLVVPTDEELMIARHTLALIGSAA